MNGQTTNTTTDTQTNGGTSGGGIRFNLPTTKSENKTTAGAMASTANYANPENNHGRSNSNLTPGVDNMPTNG